MRILKVDVSELCDGQIIAVSPTACVARIDSGIVAFARGCPHAGADLANGYVEGDAIRCAWHNVPFDPQNGKSPCATLRALQLFKARQIAADLYEVDLDDRNEFDMAGNGRGADD